MEGNTGYTPPLDDNLLGLTDQSAINEEEALGITNVALSLFELDEDATLSASLLLDWHRQAFGRLYTWAGQWRRINLQVGHHTPPPFYHVPTLIYQFFDDLTYRFSKPRTHLETVALLAWSHHRLVWIHPFLNGNGRTARLLTDAVAMLSGYAPVQIYHRSGESRKQYVNALRQADAGDLTALETLLSAQLKPL